METTELKSLAELEQLQAHDKEAPAIDLNKEVKPVDEVEDAFMRAAAFVDRGEDIPSDLLEKTGAKPVEQIDDPIKPEAEKVEAKSDDKPRDEQGRFKKAEHADPTKPDLSDPLKTEAEAESDYAKKQREIKEKEQARKDRTWEKINAEREAVAEEKRKIEAERLELQKQKEAPIVQKPQFSSAQLYDAHVDFNNRANTAIEKYVETGDEQYHREFLDNRKKAEEANKAANQIYAEEQKFRQQQSVVQRDQAWKQAIESVLPTEPDLLDNSTPLAKEVLSILGGPVDPKNPKVSMIEVFKSIPDGFRHATQIAKWKLGHDRAANLEGELTKAKAENERLTKLTSISGGGVTGAPSAGRPLQGPELDAYLLRQAQEYDRQHNFR